MKSSNVSDTDKLILALTQLTFIVLKLTGTIDWEWTWVLAPMWLPAAFAVILSLLAIVASAVTKRMK